MRTQDHPAVGDETSATELALRFTMALAARDAGALRSLFGREVDFQALSPSRVWEARAPDALIHDVILGAWFEADDAIERVELVEASHIGSRMRLGYRLQVSNASGCFAVEQQAFLDLTDGKITWLRVLCSGFIPTAETSAWSLVTGSANGQQGNQS
jgi:hypothetical protein